MIGRDSFLKHPGGCLPGSAPPAAAGDVEILVVAEGTNDIEFLRRISSMLHAHDAETPDLAGMEQQGKLVFLPNGGIISLWARRLEPLGLPEFHLLDHEVPPETELRRAAADMINARHACRAVLTNKRSLENYLHSEALRAAGGPEVDFDDFDPLPELVAKKLYVQEAPKTPWELLPRRTRKRRCHRAKRWLNMSAVDHMTPQLLAARDPDGEVASWLALIGQLAGGIV